MTVLNPSESSPVVAVGIPSSSCGQRWPQVPQKRSFDPP